MNKLKTNQIVFLILISTFLIKLIILLKFVGDKDWEPDSYMHFLQLRTVYFDFPNHLNLGLEVWAKPLFTYVLALPIAIFNLKDLLWVQIMNLGIFTFSSYLIYKICKTIYKNEAISILGMCLSLFSFLLFKSSITALTEPIFTLCLVWAFYYVVKEKYNLAALLFGLSVLGRIEGLFFVGVFNLWLVYKLFNVIQSPSASSGQALSRDTLLSNFMPRRARHDTRILFVLHIFTAWIISIVPVFIWNFLGYLDTGKLLFIFEKGYPTDPGYYGYGSWFDFPKRLALQEPLILLAFIISFFIFVKTYSKLKYNKELLLAFILASGFTFTQMWFWVIGQFGSAGLMRYLISVMPFYIVFSLLVVWWLGNKKVISSYRLLFIVIFIQVAIIAAHFIGIKPLSQKWIYFEDELRQAGVYIQDNVSEDTYVASIRPEVIYYSKRDGDLNLAAQNYRDRIFQRKKGVYVWSTDWGSAFSLTLEDMQSNAKLLKSFNDFVYVFEIE